MPGRAVERLHEARRAFSVTSRNRALRRAQLSFGGMWAGEWAATVALCVVAFRAGGAAAVGLVALVRMAPAALLAPFAATVADRLPRDRVLAGVGVVRALTLGAAALVLAAGLPVGAVYALAVVATIAQALFRPAHSALLPSLCMSPYELTSANVVRGLLDSLATLAGPLLAALLLAASGPGAVFGAAAALSLWAAVLATDLRYERPPRTEEALGGLGDLVAGARAIAGDRTLVLLTALTSAQTFMRGCLSVLTVVVSIDLLGTGDAGVGVLTAAIGLGAIAGSLGVSAFSATGRLARWFGVGVALWGAPLVAIGGAPEQAVALAALALVGVGNALVDVGVFTLLGRLAPDAVMARVFAAFEGMLTLAVGLGAVITPVVLEALGVRGALVALGLLPPCCVLAAWAALRRLDARVRARDEQIGVLQRVSMLRPLPQATVEWLAADLGTRVVAAGATVCEQGEEGDLFYVIRRGDALVLRDGERVATLGPGDGFGEIALLRDTRRVAAVRAGGSDLWLYTLSRRRFVTAVTGVCASREIADAVVERRALEDGVVLEG